MWGGCVCIFIHNLSKAGKDNENIYIYIWNLYDASFVKKIYASANDTLLKSLVLSLYVR